MGSCISQEQTGNDEEKKIIIIKNGTIFDEGKDKSNRNKFTSHERVLLNMHVQSFIHTLFIGEIMLAKKA